MKLILLFSLSVLSVACISLKDAPHCSLIARVGEGNGWVHIGVGKSFSKGVEANGYLYFAPNDNDRGNNSGLYAIRVEIY